MKTDMNSSFTAKAMAAFAVIMAFLYVGAGLYLFTIRIPDQPWLGIIMGALFTLYGAFRLFRIYQKHRNENK